MNYYPFHIGDYIAHTAHLEPLEDCAYRRLLDAYYLNEGALPADIAVCARQIRMKAHLAEVEQVLKEFFVLSDWGWSHARCDAEIARMHDKQEKAKASAEASVNARRAKAKQAGNERSTNAQRTLNERLTDVELPNTQEPITNIHNSPNPPPGDSRVDGGDPIAGRQVSPSAAVCLALKSVGVPDVNSQHSKLLSLLESGVSLERIVGVGRDCVARGKGSFRYVLGVVEREEVDARNLALQLQAPRVSLPVKAAQPHKFSAAAATIYEA